MNVTNPLMIFEGQLVNRNCMSENKVSNTVITSLFLEINEQVILLVHTKLGGMEGSPPLPMTQTYLDFDYS